MLPGERSLLEGEVGESFTKQVASELERTSQVRAPLRAEDQRCGSVGSTLGKGPTGFARPVGTGAAGERGRWQGTLLRLDGGRLGQAEGPELHRG